MPLFLALALLSHNLHWLIDCRVFVHDASKYGKSATFHQSSKFGASIDKPAQNSSKMNTHNQTPLYFCHSSFLEDN
jgi:hypothetical protein